MTDHLRKVKATRRAEKSASKAFKNAVIEAVDSGLPVVDVAAAARVTKQRIYTIPRDARERGLGSVA
jgi:hypothetical protein